MSDEVQKRSRRRTRKPTLSAREVRFCVGYADHGNITQAHKEAGFEAATDNAHVVAGRKLLRRTEVRQFVRELQQQACDEAKLTTAKIVQALSFIAFANRADLFDQHGRLKPASEWPADVAACVEGIEVDEIFQIVSEKGEPKRKELRGFNRKVKTARRVEAIKLLMMWRRMIGVDSMLAEMNAEIEELRKVLAKLKGKADGQSA